MAKNRFALIFRRHRKKIVWANGKYITITCLSHPQHFFFCIYTSTLFMRIYSPLLAPVFFPSMLFSRERSIEIKRRITGFVSARNVIEFRKESFFPL